jgi:glutamate racemase
MNRLGIIDWGIGGISVYKLITEQLGAIPITYFSDTGARPYGKMTRPELARRIDTVVEFLKAKGVTHLVIGCNAASTAIPFLIEHDIPIEGVIEPAVAMTARLKPVRLGVIGGRRTVLSGVYRRAFAKRGIVVRQRIAQPLSGLIESGDISSNDLYREAARILAPIRNCSHILLACTHYPAITPVLKSVVSTKTEFLDPAAELVHKVAHWKLPTEGGSEFLTTGNAAQMKASAKTAFSVDIGEALSILI